MFDFDDPTKSAEDRMSSTVGCVIGVVVLVVVVLCIDVFGIYELVKHITWR
jgi:hypothetical protein